MNRTRRLLVHFLLLLVIMVTASVPAAAAQPIPEQESLSDTIEMEVIGAGFGGRFRENHWLPILVRVNNTGEDLVGQIVVRPETSGDVVSSTYSTPLDLPANSLKEVFLYILVESYTQQVQVEVLDSDGFIVAREAVRLGVVLPQDQLYVYVTRPESDALSFVDVHVGGSDAAQARWTTGHIPSNATALRAVDMMFFSDVDTDALTLPQRQAIIDWVASGGHLIVTGGPNWASTAAGLGDVLPIAPSGTVNVDNVQSLALLTGDRETSLSGTVTVTTGTVQADSEIFAETEDGTPLIIRHQYGGGVVDYLAIDPVLEPMRSWGNHADLWFELVSSRPPQPSWRTGFWQWDVANDAISILPGIDLLPEVLALLVFLLGYVLIIGPINFGVLNLLKRRELAWFTIPLSIIIFTVLAWTVGFNLRGTEVQLSRLSVVESWPTTNRAHVSQLIGMLSPRRGTYTINLNANRFMRAVPRRTGGSVFGNTSANIPIQQGDSFFADEFSIDGGLFANFATDGMIERPAISGRMVMRYDPETGQQTLQGTVRNETEFTIHNPAILMRGQVYHLEESIPPGGLRTFDSSELVLPIEGTLPAPATMEHTFGLTTGVFVNAVQYFDQVARIQSVVEILGEDEFRIANRAPTFGESAADQLIRRQYAFLSSFMLDEYGSDGRGNHVYFVGWTDAAPTGLEETITGATWQSTDTTIYLTQLDVDIEYPPASREVTIHPGQFTWVTLERSGFLDGSPIYIFLNQGSAFAWEYTPLSNAILAEVDSMTFDVRLDGGFGYTRRVSVFLWNWNSEEWELIDLDPSNESSITFNNPARFIGPRNAVRIRLETDANTGGQGLREITISQTGHF